MLALSADNIITLDEVREHERAEVREHERAKAWRERLGLSVMQLEELSGYSREAIYGFEKGKRWDGKHSDFAWHRFKMACSAVERQITTGKQFDW